MNFGSDVPGRITRLPGGVAMNIAMTLRRFEMTPVLLTAVGLDDAGDEIMAACARMGITTDHVYRSDDLPTDRYMAIEGANGLVAAIADAHSLEAAGDRILLPLSNGTLGTVDKPYRGRIALDGNLTVELLHEISASPLFALADLRVAPASPGKAERILPFLKHPRATIYVNLEEAGNLCQTRFDHAKQAAADLCRLGAARVIVTDGGRGASEGNNEGISMFQPPDTLVNRVTGAGDTFMAAHIAAEARGEDRSTAFDTALRAASDYVSGEVPL